MKSVLAEKPQEHDVNTGVGDPKAVADGLSDVLADTYRILIKTHIVHWNVEGPMFYAVHNLTETQYEELFAATDVIAERIRALGHLTHMSSAALLSESVIKDVSSPQSAGDMCQNLAEDHNKIAKRLHDLISAAGDAGDPVTEDLATARSAFHEKAAWMLRSISKS